ncbi:hypothetical protein NX059_010940 [Plenodomus lindquistii]|nr:hypothetical protein NX059_010940 [Plenodomus lindquistii]
MDQTKTTGKTIEDINSGNLEGKETSIELGMLLESKDLYRSDPRAEWSVRAPSDIGVGSKETEDSAKFALIVKHDRIQEDDGSSALKLHSIQVQSPLIKALLGTVFANYPGIKTNLKKLLFLAPFREFFYRWKEFLQASEISQQDEVQAAHFKLLFDIVSAEVQPHIDEVKDLLANDVINFANLWAILEPDIDVYSLVDGQHRLYRLGRTSYAKLPDGTQVLQLSCQFVDTNGVNFGYTPTILTIGEFADVVHVVDLTVVPAHIKPNIDTIRTQLTERGKRFESLKGCHYKAYSGDYIPVDTLGGKSRKVNLRNGRIMIDDAMYDRYNKCGEKSLQPLNSSNFGRLDGSSGTIFDLFDPDGFDSLGLSPMHDDMRQARQRARRQKAQMRSQAARKSNSHSRSGID